MWGALALAVGVVGGRAALYAAIQIDQAEQMREVLRMCMYGGDRSLEAAARHGYPSIDPATFGDRSQIVLLNLRLLTRQVPALRGAEVRRMSLEELAVFPPGPNEEFRMGPDYDPKAWSGWARNAANPNRLARYLNYPALVLRAYFVSLPGNVLARLEGLLPGR